VLITMQFSKQHLTQLRSEPLRNPPDIFRVHHFLLHEINPKLQLNRQYEVDISSQFSIFDIISIY